MLLFARAGPRNREDLLSYLPERKVADRLITRYFSSMSPSQRKYRPGESTTARELTKHRYYSSTNLYQSRE